MQHFERHGQESADAESKADVFIFAEPASFDWGRCCPDDRGKYLQWEAHPPEIDGCIALRNPQVLECTISINDPLVPSLCLLDALREQGWVGKSMTVTHSMEAEKIFDDRDPVKRKSYLRCVLSCDLLFLHEVEEFPSGRAKTYYDYILKFRKLPDSRKNMKQLRNEINLAVDSDDLDIAIELPLPPPPIPSRRPKPIDDDIADESPCDIPVPIAAPPGLPPPPPSPPPIIAPEAAGAPEPEAAEAPVAAAAPIDVDAGDGWPDEVEGVQLIKMAGRDERGHRHHGRLKVVCPVHGSSCSKSRSVKMLTDELGNRAALYFLGDWLQAAFDKDEEDHCSFKPSLADMQAYKASHDPG